MFTTLVHLSRSASASPIIASRRVLNHRAPRKECIHSAHAAGPNRMLVMQYIVARIVSFESILLSSLLKLRPVEDAQHTQNFVMELITHSKGRR